MKKPVHMWRFQSSSGSGTYETLQYNDGSLSCDCPGWTRRAIRSCKHTRAVELGDANSMCTSHKALAGTTATTTTHAPDTEPAVDVVTTKAKVKSTYSRKFV